MNTEKERLGSYLTDDVTFLLKELTGVVVEQDNETRERLKAEGVHYSTMLPIEYTPTGEYMALYNKFVEDFGKDMAFMVGVLARRIVAAKSENVVLVSLARAGTPVGVLLKRYMRDVMGIDVAHYSISIVRGVGIDYNAVKYIVSNHPESRIQFVDGWTGKGAITKEMKKSDDVLRNTYGIEIDMDLAVLADPGHCADIYATREDALIPSSCLNSTVSGLMSRTVYNEEWIGEDDFHGSKYYKDLEVADVSIAFIESIESHFVSNESRVMETFLNDDMDTSILWTGLKYVESVQREYGISDINLIKPGVGETTRVLLRRVPWRILVKSLDEPMIAHILVLAEEFNVDVIENPDMPYACCGIIKDLKAGEVA